MKCILIPLDTDKPVERIDIPNNLTSIGNALKCTYIEQVKFALSPDYGVVLLVDEDGAITYPIDPAKVNLRATLLYPNGIGLVGNVIIAQLSEDESEWVDMTDTMSGFILRYIHSNIVASPSLPNPE